MNKELESGIEKLKFQLDFCVKENKGFTIFPHEAKDLLSALQQPETSEDDNQCSRKLAMEMFSGLRKYFATFEIDDARDIFYKATDKYIILKRQQEGK